jgi:hypothetical protein
VGDFKAEEEEGSLARRSSRPKSRMTADKIISTRSSHFDIAIASSPRPCKGVCNVQKASNMCRLCKEEDQVLKNNSL